MSVCPRERLLTTMPTCPASTTLTNTSVSVCITLTTP